MEEANKANKAKEINTHGFSLYDNVNDPSEIELCEYTFLLPKDVVNRFNELGNKSLGKFNKRHSISKRLARYLLCHHKLLTRRDIATLQVFLDLPEIDKKLREFDAVYNKSI